MRNLNPTSANRSGQSLMRVFAALLALVGAFAIGTFALRGNASALAQLPPLAENPSGTIDIVQLQSPVVAPLTVGTPFQIQFRLQNVSLDAQVVNAVALHFNFDPAVLEVASTVDEDGNTVYTYNKNSAFATDLAIEFNNVAGQVNFVVGTLSANPPPIAAAAFLRVVTITFIPKACSLNTTINYVMNVGTPRDTIVAGPAGQLLRDAVDTSYVIPGVACAGATATTVPATATTVPATATTVPATATTVPATATTVPATATTVPATATTVPATATTVPATATEVVASPTASATATATEVVASPTASATATATEVVASPTASATATATTVVASPTASATATATEVPATATAVPATSTTVPATATEVPATATTAPATATEVPATATAVSDPTATTVPATEVPATATLVIATNTLTPEIVTNTPVAGTATATLSGVDLTATAGAGGGGGTAIPGTATATAVAPTAGTCGLPIPSGSVVGGMPFGAQAFWAPGKLIQPSLLVNPGSYWVIGQDASETYYNILIACAFIWVRKDTMGPYSDGKNWFNNPLPTRIVS